MGSSQQLLINRAKLNFLLNYTFKNVNTVRVSTHETIIKCIHNIYITFIIIMFINCMQLRRKHYEQLYYILNIILLDYYIIDII